MKGIPGTVTPDGKYFEDQVVASYQVDGSKKLKPAAFMDIAQEVAFRAAQVMGFGYDTLLAKGKVWVLSRLHFRFVQTPRWRQEFRISTWSRGQQGPFFQREFRLEGADCQVLGTSSWIGLDVQTRTLSRMEGVLENIPPECQCDESVLEAPAPKVALPRGADASLVATRTVGYADIDFQGHTNNARYMVWATECLPFQEAETREISDVYIQFNHETKAGDLVSLYRVDEPGAYSIEGRVGDHAAFAAKIVFKA